MKELMNSIQALYITRAEQALSYVESLNHPLPEKTDFEWEQNENVKRESLQFLSNGGYSICKDDLEVMANPQVMIITKEESGFVYYREIKNGVKGKTDFMEQAIFWELVKKKFVVYVGTTTTAGAVKKYLKDDVKFTNDQPYWFKAGRVEMIKSEAEALKKQMLITPKAYESLMDWYSIQYDRI